MITNICKLCTNIKKCLPNNSKNNIDRLLKICRFFETPNETK